MLACLLVGRFVRLSVCAFVWLSVCLCVCLFDCLPACMYVCMYACLVVCLSVGGCFVCVTVRLVFVRWLAVGC